MSTIQLTTQDPVLFTVIKLTLFMQSHIWGYNFHPPTSPELDLPIIPDSCCRRLRSWVALMTKLGPKLMQAQHGIDVHYFYVQIIYLTFNLAALPTCLLQVLPSLSFIT